MAISEGLEIMFVGEPRHGAVKNHYPRRMAVPTNTQGVVVEATGKGILCDFTINNKTVRMFSPRWELRKIKRKGT